MRGRVRKSWFPPTGLGDILQVLSDDGKQVFTPAYRTKRSTGRAGCFKRPAFDRLSKRNVSEISITSWATTSLANPVRVDRGTAAAGQCSDCGPFFPSATPPSRRRRQPRPRWSACHDVFPKNFGHAKIESIFFHLSFLSTSHRRVGREDIKRAWVLNCISPLGRVN